MSPSYRPFIPPLKVHMLFLPFRLSCLSMDLPSYIVKFYQHNEVWQFRLVSHSRTFCRKEISVLFDSFPCSRTIVLNLAQKNAIITFPLLPILDMHICTCYNTDRDSFKFLRQKRGESVCINLNIRICNNDFQIIIYFFTCPIAYTRLIF